MRRLLVSLLSLAAAAVAAGCGGGGGSGSSGGLSDALGSVRDGAAARSYFGWVDLHRLQEDGAFPAHARDLPGLGQFTTLASVLQTQLLNAAIPIAEKTGIDVFAGDQALSIGEAPRRAVRLDGTDGGAFSSALTTLGARPQDALGRHFLAIGEEGGFDVKSPLAQLGVLSELDRAVVDGDTVAWGAFEAPVDEALGGSGSSLADNPSYAAAADCLGDVVTAELVPASAARIDGPAVLIAIGVPPLGNHLKPPYHEVLCVVTLDRTTADTYAAGLRRGLAPDTIEPRTNARMGELVASADVSADDTHDRGTARAEITLAGERPPGLLAQALLTGGLGAFLGQKPSPIP